MAKNQSTDDNKVEAEELKPIAGDNTVNSSKDTNLKADNLKTQVKNPNRVFKPSHKATFISLIVIAVILGVNAIVVIVLLSSSSTKKSSQPSQLINLTPKDLNSLGVSTSQIGNSKDKLVINPSTEFNSALTVAGNVQIGGQLNLNSSFSASNANFTQLQAGNTALSSLNVNGSSTVGTLSSRGNVNVQGDAYFQGNVNVGQVLTVDNNVAVANNLSVGNILTAKTVDTSNLIISGPFAFGSHIVTSGGSPTFSDGAALGVNGTASISGDDASGVVDLNIGTGAQSGTLAHIQFNSSYVSVPVVVITLVAISSTNSLSVPSIYLSDLTVDGFTINDNGSLPNGNFAVNYEVMQY